MDSSSRSATHCMAGFADKTLALSDYKTLLEEEEQLIRDGDKSANAGLNWECLCKQGC